MRLTLQQAMDLTGKSRATIFRYKRNGCDISDPASLQEYSDHADMRAKGKAAQLAWDRPLAPGAGATGASGSGVPGGASLANRALSGLFELQSAFSRKLAQAQTIRDVDESEMLAGELSDLQDAHRLLVAVLEGYEL
jgi:hypothetical protein